MKRKDILYRFLRNVDGMYRNYTHIRLWAFKESLDACGLLLSCSSQLTGRLKWKVLNTCSQNLAFIIINWRAYENRMLGLLQEFPSVDLNWDPRISISNEFPGGAEAADWWMTP